jgi:hypothetical protein
MENSRNLNANSPLVVLLCATAEHRTERSGRSTGQIYMIGKRLGASEGQIHSLYEEEEILRQKRVLLLFLRGLIRMYQSYLFLI